MRLVRVNVVFEFQVDKDIVLNCEDSIKKLENDFNAKRQNINLPQIAPPDAPRVLITFNNVLIKICQNRFEYIFEIPTHINSDSSQVFDYTFNSLKLINTYLNPNGKGYNWCGVITYIEYPRKGYKNNLDALTPIFDRIINIERRNRELASFQLQFGFLENNLYKNITLSGYDKVQFTLPNIGIPGEVFVLDISSVGKIEETGISIIVDINNKPYKKHDEALEEFSKILSESKNTIDNILDIVNIRGV